MFKNRLVLFFDILVKMFLVLVLCIAVPLLIWILSVQNIFDRFCSLIVARSKALRCRNRPKRLILIRHGESEGNHDTNIYATVPDHAIGLTENGKEQARLCGEKLKEILDPSETLSFYVSPFRRSRETCELICHSFDKKNILRVREDPRIREQEWGNFQDMNKREEGANERKKIGRFFYRFQSGESGADVYDRVSSFMDSLYREMDYLLLPNNNVCIVSHGLFMRLFLMRYYLWSVEKFHTLDNFENCGICILERNDDDADGAFTLKTQLKTFPPMIEKKRCAMENFRSQQSFNAEVHPTISTENILHDEEKSQSE